MFTLDTNILIYYAADDAEVADFLTQHHSEIFYLPSIVVAEFLCYPLITPHAITQFQDFTRQAILVNLDYAIAARSAELRRNYKVSLADAVIAASALITNSSLVTRNVRDFRKIKDLAVISP